MRIEIAESHEQIQSCFPVMSELRPELDPAEFVTRVRRQQREGFRLAYLSDADCIVAVAGFRFLEKLVAGLTMYVDDLVTRESKRSRGYGHELFSWLIAAARERGCRSVELDSGVQRILAHRFYLRERMLLRSHHFILEL